MTAASSRRSSPLAFRAAEAADERPRRRARHVRRLRSMRTRRRRRPHRPGESPLERRRPRPPEAAAAGRRPRRGAPAPTTRSTTSAARCSSSSPRSSPDPPAPVGHARPAEPTGSVTADVDRRCCSSLLALFGLASARSSTSSIVRVPAGESPAPAVEVPAVRDADRTARQHPGPLVAAAPGPVPALRRADPGRLPAGRGGQRGAVGAGRHPVRRDWVLIPYLLFFSVLLAQSVIDLELYLLLDRITFPSILVSVVAIAVVAGRRRPGRRDPRRPHRRARLRFLFLILLASS